MAESQKKPDSIVDEMIVKEARAYFLNKGLCEITVRNSFNGTLVVIKKDGCGAQCWIPPGYHIEELRQSLHVAEQFLEREIGNKRLKDGERERKRQRTGK